MNDAFTSTRPHPPRPRISLDELANMVFQQWPPSGCVRVPAFTLRPGDVVVPVGGSRFRLTEACPEGRYMRLVSRCASYGSEREFRVPAKTMFVREKTR